ncbi:transglycosylase SLT domain-containing protein [Streptomyces corynorhini]|uniref:LysM peptidoglycan-binding domain-containing protein n=1 Tax=Streptomyces corynorhini TaxID=2282652 RepID=A0A370BB94_9ACTN|nr:LysM peptidoglycan-binding domain-containing protein [Streptomyces corynorhini]RDG37639.1 LysM peptidoglycan-binding domain-containing protein [Streptomyces corynorhini]
MSAKAKHRRPRTGPLARGVVAVSAGGAVLALPLLAATTAQAAPSAGYATAGASASTAGAARQAPLTYSVVAGDSLSKIAKAHSVTGGWKKLYQDNRRAIGGDPSRIFPGQKLVLGSATKAAKPTKSATAKSSTAKSSTAKSSTGKSTAIAAQTVADAEPAALKTYSDNLDGWIRESLDIMAARGIPGSYDGIHRNIMRESSGNPAAINNWDSNAVAGTPSKGLLQVIDPTFQAYHVPGTSTNSYDPVANITAACNYAAARYGSIDNVNGPY